MRHYQYVIGFGTLTAACAAGFADPTTLTFFGALPGQTGSRAVAVSADGYTVTGLANTPSGEVAVRWTPAHGLVSLGTLPGDVTSEGVCVSADGQRIIGRSNGPSGSRAFLWTSQAGMTAFGENPLNSYPMSLAGAEDVVVGESLALTPDAARWIDGGVVSPLGGSSGGFVPGARSAFACSNDGSIVVGRADTVSGYHAFRWTEASGYQDLGTLPGGALSTAYDVSPSGSVVVGSATDPAGGEHAFRWTAAGGMQRLTSSTDFQGSIALSTSADGNTIVGVCWYNTPPYSNAPQRQPFMWTPQLGFVRLNQYLVTLGVLSFGTMNIAEATSVSDDGRVIVGWGTYRTPGPIDHYEGYMLRLAGARPLCPADLGIQGGFTGHDGQLDNNDFVAFINLFFLQDPQADVGVQGGLHGADGLWNNNDFVVFIGDFFSGCP